MLDAPGAPGSGARVELRELPWLAGVGAGHSMSMCWPTQARHTSCTACERQRMLNMSLTFGNAGGPRLPAGSGRADGRERRRPARRRPVAAHRRVDKVKFTGLTQNLQVDPAV